jgi:FkbM family methyltransferase
MNLINFSEPTLPKDEIIISEIKTANLPAVLYGASADVAGRIVAKLAKAGISVPYAVFNDETPMCKDALPKDVSIVHTDEIDSLLPDFFLIAGFVKIYPNIGILKDKFRNARNAGYLSEIFDMEPITNEYVNEHCDEFVNTCNSLADELSRASFEQYLLSKTYQDAMFLWRYFKKDQYLTADIIKLSETEAFFDCGAFIGDTIDDFLKHTGGRYGKIWAVEPDKRNFQQLTKYVKDKGLANISLYNKGLYSSSGKLRFKDEGSMLSALSDEADDYIEVETIDNIISHKRVSFIKMDVEGAELEALKGAAKTITRCKPTLAIAAYHRKEDLLAIPEYVMRLVPDYKIYFRPHKKLAIDAVLYFVPPINC